MSHESESALERIFEYFRAFCRGRRPSCVKVVELFVVDGEMDVDAVSELSNLLRNKNVKNNILEISCGLSFRYDSSKRERGVLCSSVVDFDFHDVHAKKLVEGLHSYIPQRAKELAMKLTSTCGDDCELEDAIETLRRWNMNVFGSLTLKKVKRWREAEARTKEKRGRKVFKHYLNGKMT